jgi:hypothetical protein
LPPDGFHCLVVFVLILNALSFIGPELLIFRRHRNHIIFRHHLERIIFCRHPERSEGSLSLLPRGPTPKGEPQKLMPWRICCKFVVTLRAGGGYVSALAVAGLFCCHSAAERRNLLLAVAFFCRAFYSPPSPQAEGSASLPLIPAETLHQSGGLN